MGFSLWGDASNTSSNTTQNYDQSQRQSTASQSGTALQGNTIGGAVINNDANLVGMGIENNNIAATVMNHLGSIVGATVGKLSDTVKQTSNDTLTAAVNNSAVQKSTGAVLNNLSDNMQKYLAIAAAGLGAWYLLKRK